MPEDTESRKKSPKKQQQKTLADLIYDHRGAVLVREQAEQTLADYCILALLSSESSAKILGDQKIRRAILANKLINNPKVELTAEEKTDLKACVGESCMPWIVYQIFKVIDPASVKE